MREIIMYKNPGGGCGGYKPLPTPEPDGNGVATGEACPHPWDGNKPILPVIPEPDEM
jgi:hypothetical protein